VWEQVGKLHEYHGDVPAEIRLLKVTEEVGEAAEALIGMQSGGRGPGPRSPGTAAGCGVRPGRAVTPAAHNISC